MAEPNAYLDFSLLYLDGRWYILLIRTIEYLVNGLVSIEMYI